ncbi:MAG TPA: S9 family peptidase [Terriglobales bacterium]|nr:S9 family peptidase [Terriglobales bacterium]
MLRKGLFVVVLLSSLSFAQTLTPPQAETNPENVIAKMRPDLANYSLERFFLSRQIGASSWAPDGKKVVVVSNLSGRENLWTVDSSGGWPQQLTIGDQRQSKPAWSPDGVWIAYQSDYGGNEQWDLFMVSPKNGEVAQLTRTPHIAESSPVWSPDGHRLAFLIKPKTSPTNELALLDVLTRKVRNLTTGTPKELSNSHPIWSPDGKWIAYTQANAAGDDSNVFLLEVATAKSTNLTPHEGAKLFEATSFSPDGKHLLITSDAQNGFANVALLEIATKKPDWITHEKWEVFSGDFSPDGRFITWTANTDGVIDIYRYEIATKKAEKLPLAAGVSRLAGSTTAFSKDGTRLLYRHEGYNAPNDIWTYSFSTRQSKQLTNSMSGSLDPNDMVRPYLVHYPSRDGKFTISAWVYMPYNIGRNNTYPAILWIHGGPNSQTLNGFNPFMQYILNQGYIVVAPNYRGSTGYGKQFERANILDMGGGDLQDNLAAMDFIQKTGYADPKKMIVMGRSFGGYLTMMAVTKAPEMWAAGVAIVPFVNWFTEFEHEDPAIQQSDLVAMGDPVKNKALWEDRSPINFVDRIKAPLLLIAGENDPRCPPSEAQQVADAIKKRGGTVQLKIYEDEGHSFGKWENVIDHYKRVSDFLKVQVPSPGCQTVCEIQ